MRRNVGRMAVTRASHLIDLVNAAGVSATEADSELALAGLPAAAIEKPDALVSLSRVYDFLESSRRQASPVEITQFAVAMMRFDSLGLGMRNDILSAVTGLDALRAVVRHIGLEDSTHRADISVEGDCLAVSFAYDLFTARPAHVIAEWQAIAGVVEIGKILAGPDWTPPEIRILRGRSVPVGMQEVFYPARIRAVGNKTCVLFPRALVGRPWPPALENTHSDASQDSAPRENLILRELIRPYISESAPTLAEAADLAGLSGRTLQRRLATEGRRYCDVVDEARHLLACELLADPDARIIDVAFATGYANHTHFTRAFGRRTGLTPTAYRRTMLQQ